MIKALILTQLCNTLHRFSIDDGVSCREFSESLGMEFGRADLACESQFAYSHEVWIERFIFCLTPDGSSEREIESAFVQFPFSWYIDEQIKGSEIDFEVFFEDGDDEIDSLGIASYDVSLGIFAVDFVEEDFDGDEDGSTIIQSDAQYGAWRADMVIGEDVTGEIVYSA